MNQVFNEHWSFTIFTVNNSLAEFLDENLQTQVTIVTTENIYRESVCFIQVDMCQISRQTPG